MDLGGCRVAIVGAGIGGLAAAVALRAAGAQVTVFEKARRQQQGVALLVWGNAIKQLATLDLANDVLALSSPIEVTRVRAPAGDVLCELPIGEWSRGVSMQTVVVRRADLLAALARAVPADIIRDQEVTGFAASGARVRVELDGAAPELFDALIGADGLHSKIRAQLHGTEPPRALRQQAWVGFAAGASDALEPGIATATVGRGPRFWAAPLGSGVFWYATLNELVSGPGHDALLATFGRWHAPIRELIERSDPDAIVTTQIRDRVPLRHWGEGRVTLLGDAAHPSTPDLGQGACQAIESATVLASSLARADSIEAGLRAYERARIPRTTTISRLCWMTAVNSTIENAALCTLRDAAVRMGLRTVARGHLEWILAGPAC